MAMNRSKLFTAVRYNTYFKPNKKEGVNEYEVVSYDGVLEYDDSALFKFGG